MQTIRDEMESYAKEILFTRFNIDVRHMDPQGIAEVRKTWPRIGSLVAQENREIVKLLLDLAHTGDRILAEIVGDGE